MSRKHFLFAASASVLLCACGSDTSDQEAPAPAEAIEEISTEPEILDPARVDEAVVEETENSPARSADAHVHGDASLSIALDGTTLTLELDSPLYNITGFEHSAETAEQKAAIESAESSLNEPANLFLINAEAGCTAQTDGLDVHLEPDDGDHDGHAHEEHAHDDGDGGEHDEDTHKDVLITYTFECANADQLNSIDVDMLTQFPNMTDLEVVYVGPGNQELFELSPTSTQINLSR